MTSAGHPKSTSVPPSLDPTDGPLTVDELGPASAIAGCRFEAMCYDLTPTVTATTPCSG